MSKENIVLLGCGDVAPVHEPMEPYSTFVRSVLATGDIRFSQVERTYSDRGTRQAHGSPTSRNKPHMASVFSDCGFNVVSVASNHAMDWGEEALVDTIAVLQKRGMQIIGGGRNLQEARKPAIFEKNGVRVAVLAYCSVLSAGQEAGPNRPGAAPVRIHNYYQPIENQPGLPPRVVTIPYAEDLEAMTEDIAKAKKEAHAVVLSLHWGLHYIPRAIAEYQPLVAKAAFKAGADLIIGHHAHVAKAIEVFDGKVCFYSLGNFIMSDFSAEKPEFFEKMKRYGVTPNVDDYPRCPHGKDSKHTFIVKAVISREGVKKVSFLPVQIDKQLRPEVLNRGDPRFDETVNFMDWASEGLNHKFQIEGDEVVLTN